MSAIKITLDELRAEVEKLRKIDNPKGFTSAEFEDAIGLSRSASLLRLAKMVRGGRIKCVGRRNNTRIDGRPGFSPVYVLVKAPKK